LLLNTQTEYTSIANKIKQNETLLSLLTTVDDVQLQKSQYMNYLANSFDIFGNYLKVNKMFSLYDKEIAERHFIQASLAILHIVRRLSDLKINRHSGGRFKNLEDINE